MTSGTRAIGWTQTSRPCAPRSPRRSVFSPSPRSVLRGASLLTTDLTTERTFRLNERLKFELRGEFYNLFNHANFNAPGVTYGAADFGVVTSAHPGRTVQLAVRLAF